MKKIFIKYSGAILLYTVIIIGVLVLNSRFRYLNEVENDRKGVSFEQIAVSD